MSSTTDKNKKVAAKNFMELASEAQHIEQLQDRAKKERFFQRFQQEFKQPRTVEVSVFTEAEQRAKLEIVAVQQELKKLAESTKHLTKEVEVAVRQDPVNPGVYHLSFLQKLRRKIILFKKRVDESASWLDEFNYRATKKGYYWGQVKKSGTKFMLSQERYMATQVG